MTQPPAKRLVTEQNLEIKLGAFLTSEDVELITGNLYKMPDWNGTGPHPLRPTFVSAETCVIWPQPSAPLITAGYALPGDRWETL